ncbi:MAG: LPS assembly lipoprotein LptE [Acidobacteriota bacterium]
MKQVQLWSALAALAGAQLACGYSLAGKGDFLPAYIKVIGIPTFQNRSDQVEIEEIFTQKVVEEFNSRGKYVVRPDAVGVDAVLLGTVLAFTVAPAVLESGEDDQAANQAARYHVVVRAQVEFQDLLENKTIWSDKSFAFREEYDVGENPDEFFDQSGLAVERLAEEFAKTLVSRILEAF